jgi:hypothetical protein
MLNTNNNLPLFSTIWNIKTMPDKGNFGVNYHFGKDGVLAITKKQVINKELLTNHVNPLRLSAPEVTPKLALEDTTEAPVVPEGIDDFQDAKF